MKDMQPTRSGEGTDFPSVHVKDVGNVEGRKPPIHCGDILPCSCKATVNYVGHVDMLCTPHHEYEAQTPGSARKFAYLCRRLCLARYAWLARTRGEFSARSARARIHICGPKGSLLKESLRY